MVLFHHGHNKNSSSSQEEDDKVEEDDDDRTKSTIFLQAFTPHNHITLLKTVNISHSNRSSISDIQSHKAKRSKWEEKKNALDYQNHNDVISIGDFCSIQQYTTYIYFNTTIRNNWLNHEEGLIDRSMEYTRWH